MKSFRAGVFWAGVLMVITAIAIHLPQTALTVAWPSQTEGVVVRVNRGNHASVFVRYSVQSKSYEQVFGPYYWQVGKQVQVNYCTYIPSISEVEQPRIVLANKIQIVLMFTVMSAIFVAAVALVRRRSGTGVRG